MSKLQLENEMKLIVCCDKNGGIGKNGTIPWNCPVDMAHFVNTTTGNTVVMGRKTAESIPARSFPLKNRYSIVISRKGPFAGAHVTLSNPDQLPHIQPVGEVFIIGGASIYDYYLGLGYVDEVIMTILPDTYDCDTFFPFHHLDSDFVKEKKYKLLLNELAYNEGVIYRWKQKPGK